jgi:hypothetical protein
MSWLKNLVESINLVSNTVWGMLLLASSIYVACHYNKDIGIYFAGVGSTLIGIKRSSEMPNTIFTQSDSNPPKVKVETNASDQSDKN